MSMITFPKTKRKGADEWTFSGNVIPAASIFELTITSGGSVVASPIEQGSFTSYNKTTEPLHIAATLSFSGTDGFLHSVLDNLSTLKDGVTTFSIETPVYEYENMTLQSYDYAMRREDGRGVLYVNAEFVEIKEVALAYTQQETIEPEDCTDPSDASTQDTGLQQAQDPTDDQAAAGRESIIYKASTFF